MTRTITASQLRKSQKAVFDEVCNNHETLFMTRHQGENIVIMSESDYLSLNETAYLLFSPINRKRLKDAMQSKGTIFSDIYALEEELGH